MNRKYLRHILNYIKKYPDKKEDIFDRIHIKSRDSFELWDTIIPNHENIS